jgi:hypothetical protein
VSKKVTARGECKKSLRHLAAKVGCIVQTIISYRGRVVWEALDVER